MHAIATNLINNQKWTVWWTLHDLVPEETPTCCNEILGLFETKM